jgi:tRNA 5-methylaminomethyl-2-thiouridine biosynthesis bifunctional protein
MTKQTILSPAQLTWQNTTPISVSFGGVYFSSDDGLNESRYVFLKPNRILERLSEGDLTQPFIIAETRFGTALNFLITWQAWKQLPSPKRPLHFFSLEISPLRKDDLSKALSTWPELSEFIKPLIKQYPSMVAGLHSLEFESAQVRLSLLFGNVITDLSHVIFEADAWFLDGFVTNKRPGIWTNQFFELLSEKSKQGTTFSTFSSASNVRNSLSEAGFKVQEQEGFCKKSEMFFGDFLPYNEASVNKTTINNLWSYQDQRLNNIFALKTSPSQTEIQYDVAIIGAGLSGLATAYELIQQGLKVCIVEKKSGPVKGASGQNQLAMYAKLPSEASKLFHFIIQAFSGSIRFYDNLQTKTGQLGSNRFWHQTGLLQLAWNNKESIKQRKFVANIRLPEDIIEFIDSQNASEKSGLDINVDALWFQNAGWLDPVDYSKSLLSNFPIDTFYDQNISALAFNEDKQYWTLQKANIQQTISAKYVVIANSNDAKRFSQLNHLPSKPIRGQVTSIKHQNLKAAKTVICGEGYLCPSLNNWHHFGATFDLKCDEPIIKESDTQQNINSLQKWLPEWLQDATIDAAEFHHSAGLRCTTPDYLPIVGQAPIADKMIEDFAKLRVDSTTCKDKHGSYYPNLFVNIGHGSKGLFTTPLAAQIIRYHICGGFPPCLEEQRVMLSPARFIIKYLKQHRL